MLSALATLSFPEGEPSNLGPLFASLALPIVRCLSDLLSEPPRRAIPRTITLARPRGVDVDDAVVFPSLNLTAAASDSILSAASKAADTAVARLWFD